MSTRCKACDKELPRINMRVAVLENKQTVRLLEDLCSYCLDSVYNIPEIKAMLFNDLEVNLYDDEDS